MNDYWKQAEGLQYYFIVIAIATFVCLVFMLHEYYKKDDFF